MNIRSLTGFACPHARRARPSTFLLSVGARLGALGVALVLAGCAAAPGMKLDGGPRADLISVDPDTVRQLRDQARARASAAPVLPAAFAGDGREFEYRVAPQDVLRVTVWNQPELTNPSNTSNELSGRIVNSDGTLFFPHVGSFRAAGLTVQELREVITRGLLKVIKQPQVDVSVLQYRGQRIYVSGEVRQPGSVPVTDVPPDLTEIIARAGGTTAEADLGAVTVTRGAEQLRVDMVALYYGGDLRANVRLRHGDVVNVPERRANKVFVMGEVLLPRSLFMTRGVLTLADALAEAGGVNPLSANAGQVFVLRGNGSGSGTGSEDVRTRVYHLNASSPDALILADQFPLNSRDVIYVDTAAVVRWSRVMNNLLGSASLARELLNDNLRGLPR